MFFCHFTLFCLYQIICSSDSCFSEQCNILFYIPIVNEKRMQIETVTCYSQLKSCLCFLRYKFSTSGVSCMSFPQEKSEWLWKPDNLYINLNANKKDMELHLFSPSMRKGCPYWILLYVQLNTLVRVKITT